MRQVFCDIQRKKAHMLPNTRYGKDLRPLKPLTAPTWIRKQFNRVGSVLVNKCNGGNGKRQAILPCNDGSFPSAARFQLGMNFPRRRRMCAE